MKNAAAAEPQALGEVCALSKYRIMFSKLNMAKYISHLDLLRCFTRAIMRSGLPVKYSQGFNPHMKLTFSLPLSIGVTSECETADIEFSDGTSTDEIREKLSVNLPPDIRVLDVYAPRMSANDIVSAEYKITLFTDEPLNSKDIKEFFGRSEVTIIKMTKKTKKTGGAEVNLMDYVKGASLITDKAEKTADGYKTELNLTLSAGGQSNLKPEIAVTACAEALPQAVTSYDIHRTKIFAQNGDVLAEFA